MKVNVISDIHATVDKDLNVVYNMPRKSVNKLKNTIATIKAYWTEHEKQLRESKIAYLDANLLYPETIVVKSHDDILLWLDKYEKCLDDDFASIKTNDDMFQMSRALNNIETFFYSVDKDWDYRKNIVSIQSMVDYMFKCKYDFDPAKLEPADYLIIAGDLGVEPVYDLVLEDIKKKTEGKFKRVLHIAGNHDHWWFRVDHLSEIRPDHINLEHEYCEHVDGDYAFIGCTMWTPLKERDIWSVGRYMNDYRYTPGKFSPYASSHQYDIQSAWIREKLAKYADKKVVVFTHHQPFEELTLDDYKHNGKGWDGEDVNAAYVVQDHSLDDINEQYHNIVLWACGHTHQNFDGMLHGIHVVRNPIGYRDITTGRSFPENMSETWYNKIIEV